MDTNATSQSLKTSVNLMNSAL